MTTASAANLSTLRVLAIPAFQDNYLWLIHDGIHAAVVDPGDAGPVANALAEHRLTLTAILLTHHHADHIGGVASLVAHWGAPVFGPRHEAIAGIDTRLGEGDVVDVPGLALRLRVLDVPGHTSGHIAYVRDGATPWLFCGDTLFAAGCGRLFEGTPTQMRASLRKLAQLPPATLVYCAHEYTLANLRFAAAVEPGNPALQERIARDQARRAAGEPTVPTTIAVELATNPFLRDGAPEIAASLAAAGKIDGPADPLNVFTALRSWKNHF